MYKREKKRAIMQWKDRTEFDKVMFFWGFFVILSVGIFVFRGANLSFSSDSAAANVLAREQRLTGELVPSSWNYSTDLMVWFINIPIAILQIFFSNELFIRSLSVLCFVICTMIIVKKCCEQLCPGYFYEMAIIMIFIGISGTFIDMVLAQGAYIVAIFNTFCGFYLFVSSIDQNYNIIKRRNYVFLLGLIFMQGIFGIVILQQVMLPLVGAVILMEFIENYNVKINTISKIKAILRVLSGVIVISVIALLVYVFVIDFHVNNLMLKMKDPIGIIDNLATIAAGWLLLLGVNGSTTMLSLQGIRYIFHLFLGILLIIGSLLLTKKYKTETFSVRLFILYSWIHIIEVLLILFLGSGAVDNIAVARYLITPCCLMIVMSCLYLYKYIIKRDSLATLKNIIAIIFISFFVLINGSEKILLSFVNYNVNMQNKFGVIDFLKDNQLEYGYASFWNAEIYSVGSDFKVQIHPIGWSGKLFPYYWLTSSNNYKKENYEGPTFLMLEQEQFETLKTDVGYGFKELGEPVKILNYNQYVIQVYDYNICENDFNGSSELNLMSMMDYSDTSMKLKSGAVEIKPGQVLFGPYISLLAGHYSLEVEVGSENDILLNVTENAGQGIVQSIILKPGRHKYIFNIDTNKENIEFNITNDSEQVIIINDIILYR